MQPDNIILPIIHKWAKILWRKNLDYDELVAIGYCATKPLDSDKTEEIIASWAKWMMIKFISNNKLPVLTKQPEDLIIYTDNNAIIDIKDAINDLSDYEAQLIYMRYWRGMTLNEIAKQFNKSFSWARDNCNRVLGLLKERLLQ